MRIEILDLNHITGVANNLCYGITRTNEMADKKAQSYKTDQPLYVYFHLPAGTGPEQREQTRLTLKRRYALMAPDVVLVDKIEDVPNSVPFVMGTRGASPQLRDEAKRRLETIMDTTCPYVTAQEAAARKLMDEGYELVFCGRPDYHGVPRLRGVAKTADRQLHVAHRPEDVEKLPFKRSTRVGAILQTTWHMSLAKNVIAELASRFREIKVVDTSCIDSLGRVPAARKAAEEHDAVVVVDVGNVARYLIEEMEELARHSAKSQPARVYRIEAASQLLPEWFAGVESVGVIGGINVHSQVLDGVAERIRELAEVHA